MDDNTLEQRILLKANDLSERLRKIIDPITQHKKFIIVEVLLVLSPLWLPIFFSFLVRLIVGGAQTGLSFIALAVIAFSYFLGVRALFRITKQGLNNRIISFLIYLICMAIPSFFTGWLCLGLLLIK